MAELDKNGSITWALPVDTDDEADMAELNSHPKLIEQYGQLLMDLSAIVGDAAKIHKIEALSFFTKAFKIIIITAVKVLKENAKV